MLYIYHEERLVMHQVRPSIRQLPYVVQHVREVYRRFEGLFLMMHKLVIILRTEDLPFLQVKV